MSEKWNMVSPFSYSLNNPIKYSDPNGEDIWINYGEKDDEKVRYSNGQLYTTNGDIYQGSNAFVIQTFKVLSSWANNSTGGMNVVNELASASNFIWNISQATDGQTNNTLGIYAEMNQLTPTSSESATTTWDPTAGNIDQSQNAHAPAGGLVHEGGHAYLQFRNFLYLMQGIKNNDRKSSESRVLMNRTIADFPRGGGWDFQEEKDVIERFENPYLQNTLGEQPRPNHRGMFYKTTDAMSTIPLNGDKPTYIPRSIRPKLPK